jgi:hypothetical protein
MKYFYSRKKNNTSFSLSQKLGGKGVFSFLCVGLLLIVGGYVKAQVVIGATGSSYETSYTQDFNTLSTNATSNVAWNNATTLGGGWMVYNNNYQSYPGVSLASKTYSLGSSNTDTNRSLGVHSTSSTQRNFMLRLQNGNDKKIVSMTISFDYAEYVKVGTDLQKQQDGLTFGYTTSILSSLPTGSGANSVSQLSIAGTGGTTLATGSKSFTITDLSILKDGGISLVWADKYAGGSGYYVLIGIDNLNITWTYEEDACSATIPTDLTKTNNCDGATAILSSTATPAAGDTWYWQTSATGTDKIHTSPYSVNAAGTYYLRAYNATEECWSAAESIAVAAADISLPSITGNADVDLSSTLTLTGEPSGGVWSVAPVGAATISNGVLTPITAGSVMVTYTVNGCSVDKPITIGTCDQITATYTLNGNTTVCAGAPVTLNLSGSQTNVSYQLYNGATKVGTAIVGTGAAISFAAVSPTATTTYTVKGYGTTGTYCATETAMTGANVTVTVNPATAITTQPQGATYTTGATPAALSVTATGSGLTYQWYSNTTNSTTSGTAISGATAATLPAANISTATEGSTYYYVVITGACGNITSSVAEVKVADVDCSDTNSCPYTYECEGFEGSEWNTVATGSGWTGTVNSSTGSWVLSKVKRNTSDKNTGSNSLNPSSSDSYIQTPVLMSGAAKLTFYAMYNGKTIVVDVYDSSNKKIKTETFTTTSTWTKYELNVNDPAASYIRIVRGSDNNVKVDDICITPVSCEISSIASIANMGYVEGDTPVAQSFTVDYKNLPAADKTITITPPANFEVMVPGGTPASWSAGPVTHTPSLSAGSLSGVQVRMIAGLTEAGNPYEGDLEITTSDSNCKTTIALSGDIFSASACYITMPAEVDGLDYETGEEPNIESFNISWRNITTGSIEIRTPGNFEISVNDGEWTSSYVTYPIEDDEAQQGSVPVRVRLLGGLPKGTYSGTMPVIADATCWDEVVLKGNVVEAVILPVECGEDATTITTHWELTSNNNSSTEITDYIQGEAVVLGAQVKASTGNNTDGTRLKSSSSWPATATEGFHLDIPFSVMEGYNATIRTITCTIKSSSGTAATSYLLQYSVNGGEWTDFDTQRGPTSSGSAVQATFTSASPVLLGSTQRIVFRLLPIGYSSNSRNLYIKNISIGGTTCEEQRTPAELEVDKTSIAGFTSDGCTNNVDSFTVIGSNLRPASGALTLSGADAYEYSFSSDFSSTVTSLPYSNGSIEQLVYVRLKQGLLANTYNQTLSIAGGGYKGDPVTVALNGTSTGTTSIAAGALISGFTYVDTDNGPSTAQTGTLTLTNIPAGSTINLSMLQGNFEYSLDGTNYSTTGTLIAAGSPQTIYYRLKAGLSVMNYADTLVATYDCYTAKQALAGVVTSGSGCSFTASVTDITGLDYASGSGPSASQTFVVNIRNYPASTNPTITLSNTNFEYSFNGSSWISSSSTSRSELKLENGDVTMYVRLKTSKSVGAYSGKITITPSNCGEIVVNLSGNVYEVPVVVIKDDLGRGIEMVCEDAMNGNPIITLTADKTSTGPWIWEYNNTEDEAGWITLPQNSKTISVSPPNGITTYRVTVNGVTSAEKVFRTMVCCSVVGNSQLIFSNDFGTVTGGGRDTSEWVTNSYSYSGSGEIKDGQYAVVNNANANTYWKNLSDHTGNTNGAMLVFNGSAPGQIAYRREYIGELCPNTLYNFSAWVVNLHRTTDSNRPNLTFNILDAGGEVLASTSTGDIAIGDGWKESGVTFNSGAGGQHVILEIVSSKPAGGGNDFGIDDITFTSCTPETYLTIDGLKAIDYVLCEGNRLLDMVSNCDYDITAFYPTVAYGFLYRTLKDTDSASSDFHYTDWVLAQWPQNDNEYQFDTSVLEEGETYTFMSITANDSAVVKKVTDYYTGLAATIELNGCEKYSASTVSKVRQPDMPDLEAHFFPNDTVCKTNGGTLTARIELINNANDSVLAEGKFDVNIPGLHIISDTNRELTIDVTQSDAGTYTITYRLPPDSGDTEQNVCDEFTYTSSLTILEDIVPTVTIETDVTTVCAGVGGVEFTATVTDAGENPTYQWYLNNADVPGATSSTYLCADIEDGDEVYCVVTNTDLCGVAGTSNTITIAVEDPTVEITSDNGTVLSCILPSVTLTATPSVLGGTYTWQPGSTTGSTKTANAAGSYSVVYETPNGCVAMDDIEITFQNPPLPSLTITNPPAECEPNTVDITAAAITAGSANPIAPLSYWKDAGGTTQPLTPQEAAAIAVDGTYYIKTAADECGNIEIKPVVVTIYPKPVTSVIDCN